MDKKDGQTVWFNGKQVSDFKDIKKVGIVSQTFPQYIKSAFHEKLDRDKVEAKRIQIEARS